MRLLALYAIAINIIIVMCATPGVRRYIELPHYIAEVEASNISPPLHAQSGVDQQGSRWILITCQGRNFRFSFQEIDYTVDGGEGFGFRYEIDYRDGLTDTVILKDITSGSFSDRHWYLADEADERSESIRVDIDKRIFNSDQYITIDITDLVMNIHISIFFSDPVIRG